MAKDKSSGKRITIRELARLAGTSPGTVSRALNGNTRISESVSTKIRKLASKHGYVPNQQARNLQKGGSQFLGFLASDLLNFAFLNIFRQLEAMCRKRGFSLIIADSERSAKLEREHVDYFLRLDVRGMFVSSVADWNSQASCEHLDVFLKNGIPTVAVDHSFRPGISSVFNDETNAAARLIAELQKLGHTHFLLVAYESPKNIVARMRIEGMRQAIASIPGGVVTDVIKSDRSSKWKNRVVRAVAAHHPTAIVTVDEFEALSLYQPLTEAGISIPGDVSLAAFGSSNFWIKDLVPSLTACHNNDSALVDSAMSLLFEKMERPATPDRHVSIPQQLFLRNSTAKARISG